MQFTEALFFFPNECTNELMDLTGHQPLITCHDQQRADSTSSEKCGNPVRDVNATGSDHRRNHLAGQRHVQDDFVTAGQLQFLFSNRGKVHLISRGSAVNNHHHL